eukprot:6510037-Pyramimonas_sp.AAC.1
MERIGLRARVWCRGGLLEPDCAIAIAGVRIGRDEDFMREHTTKEMKSVDSETDAKVLRVQYGAEGGARHRTWKYVEEGISEVPVADWPMEGPRAVRRYVTAFGQDAHGGTPPDDHHGWRHDAKLNPSYCG